jgi:hypothetical protein
MSFIAALFALAALWALVTGRAQRLGGTVNRASAPVPYWASVILCVLLAGLIFSLGPVR